MSARIAYLANRFPEEVEPYVWEEIFELRARCDVTPCSFRRVLSVPLAAESLASETQYVFPPRPRIALAASWLCLIKFSAIAEFMRRAIQRPEPLSRRLRTLVHTWLGACLAVTLRDRQISHIHVHHGYFASWAGMVAARLLGADFSFTLHGSDLLLRADYLDCKLKHCKFCVTISGFNRDYILKHYPATPAQKIRTHRLGIEISSWVPVERESNSDVFTILSVGRLHSVKNHPFLLLACRALKSSGVQFRCVIVGEGPERERLEDLIEKLELNEEVTLAGRAPRKHLPRFYAEADVVVLTSHSEGIPVTLMEAMAMQRVVLAPRITGIPELVTDAKTGFLYESNSMEEFLAKIHTIRSGGPLIERVRISAREQVEMKFNRATNLKDFSEDFLEQIQGNNIPTAPAPESPYEDPLLQQVQLRIQRDRSLPV